MIVHLGLPIRLLLTIRLRRGQPPRGSRPQPRRRGHHACLRRPTVAAPSPEEVVAAHVARGLVGLRHQEPEASDEALAGIGGWYAIVGRVRLTAVQSVVVQWALLMCTKEHGNVNEALD